MSVTLEKISKKTLKHIADNLREADYAEMQKVLKEENPKVHKVIRKTVKASYLTGVVRTPEGEPAAIFGFARKPWQVCKSMNGEVCWLLGTDRFLDKDVIVTATRELQKITEERLAEAGRLFNLISLENTKYLKWLKHIAPNVRYFESFIPGVALFFLEN